MRKGILSLVSGTVMMLVAAACTPRSAVDRADTSVALPEAVAITPRGSAAVVAPEIAVGTAPLLPIAVTASDSRVVVKPITCTPSTLRPGDTLMLGMGTPHGNELNIHAPNRTVYSLVYPNWGKSARNYSLIPSDEFKNIAVFPIPADVRAIPLVKGRDTILEPVFTAAGKYLIVMGENLASDYSNRSTYCTATFFPRSE